jgi:hypothetical protein
MLFFFGAHSKRIYIKTADLSRLKTQHYLRKQFAALLSKQK